MGNRGIIGKGEVRLIDRKVWEKERYGGEVCLT
jgi:hypothetical protein